jgi:2-polyprenyl-6-methoxyphenol hydroxylase-like FAD-dependent oxidoreductase
MSTRIIDLKAARTATGHADGIHSRTLEIFDSFGIVDSIIRKGVHEVEMSYWVCFSVFFFPPFWCVFVALWFCLWWGQD